MLLLLLVLLHCVSASGLTHETIAAEWNLFKIKFNKTYSSAMEEARRSTVFGLHLDMIGRHNAAADAGKYLYHLGINHFSDMTDEEFEEQILNKNMRPVLSERLVPPIKESVNLTSYPKQIDWRDSKCVTAVKDQGKCQSCYAFATTGALETLNCLKNNGRLVSLSEQNIVDCTTNNLYQNNGCEGGKIDAAFIYVIDNGGVDTELAYPYEQTVGTCKYQKSAVGATAKAFVDVPRGNEFELQKVVGGNGPVSVSIDARSFKLYSTGIFDKVECSRTELNHGMLVVGYGTEAGQDYWLIKNSWNTDWGIAGYNVHEAGTQQRQPLWNSHVSQLSCGVNAGQCCHVVGINMTVTFSHIILI